MWKVLAVVLMLAGTAQADEPASGGRIAGEVALGTLGTIGGGVSGFLVGAAVARDWEDDKGDFVILAASTAAGATLGATLGVYVVGDTNEHTGSFKATLGGAAIGSVIAAGGALALSHEGNNRGTSILLLLAGPTAGATIGFNLTRRTRTTIAPVVTNHTVGIAGSF